jgi:hypothetical protein
MVDSLKLKVLEGKKGKDNAETQRALRFEEKSRLARDTEVR